tara:strand:- start:63 stop:656 length:594 start_codon:yes stop_codon:yes gene_type:complete
MTPSRKNTKTKHKKVQHKKKNRTLKGGMRGNFSKFGMRQAKSLTSPSIIPSGMNQFNNFPSPEPLTPPQTLPSPPPPRSIYKQLGNSRKYFVNSFNKTRIKREINSIRSELRKLNSKIDTNEKNRVIMKKKLIDSTEKFKKEKSDFESKKQNFELTKDSLEFQKEALNIEKDLLLQTHTEMVESLDEKQALLRQFKK